MKTVKDYILDIIDEKNKNHEILEEDTLEQGINQYIEDRNIEQNLARFINNEQLYTKIALLKVKHFKTFTFEMLVFYFMNYSIITELLMMKGDICYRRDHNIPITKQEALDLYHHSLTLAGKCKKLEYSYQTIDVHLKDIKNLLKITE